MKSPHITGPTDLVAQEGLYRPGAPPSPPPKGLLATYSGDNGTTDIAVTVAITPLVTVPGVVVGPNEKVIVHASIYYSNTTGAKGTLFTGIFASSGGPLVPIDTSGETSSPAEQHVVTRSFEITMPAPSTYTFEVQGQTADGLTGATVVGSPPGTGLTPAARLVVEVVNV